MADTVSWASRARSRAGASAILVLAGLSWAAISVLDPLHPRGAIGGPLLVLSALLWRVLRGRDPKLTAFAAILSVGYGLAASIPLEFRADSRSYFMYLRSLSFDRDLDFRNDRDALTGSSSPNPEEARRNVFSIGPAVLWSPFYAAAHAYVVLASKLGRGSHAADGYSVPYRRATALGTVTVVVIGAILLASTLTAFLGPKVASLSVLGAIFASPVLYYAFYLPSMAHGVAFGVASALLWAWDRARSNPSLGSWIVLGGTLGLLMLCRWQGAVYGILVLLLAVEGIRRKAVRPTWVLAAAAAAVLAFGPQAIVWKLQFDRWLLIPQGRGFLDISSPSWARTLFSANHGFFNWTPLMLVGLIGLALGVRKNPLLCGAGLLVFVATVWVNGSVPLYDFAAGDAYGARRYSLVVPLLALGLGYGIEAYRAVARRAPLLAPAVAILLAGLWNVGFVSQFRARKYREMAPLERLARDQARSLRLAAQDVLGGLAGKRGRAFAYDVFSAEYFYTSFNRHGGIDLRSADETFLMHGWHTPSRRTSRRPFRRALHPEACVRIPLFEPFPLRITVTARAPAGLDHQSMSVAVNGNAVAAATLTHQWREVRFIVPEDQLVHGENALCLGFTNALPEENGRRVAAHVERIQLP
ncbi:MAG TPA: hypothetical protein VEK15_02080 [Vicinamibacteria bacterium]|nr:hypothetical protein [Vicinamibacteria bacterium]